MSSGKDLQEFKLYMKLKLLDSYKDEDNFRQMIEYLNSTNVNQYQWRDESEKRRISESLQIIERYTFIPEEEKEEYQLNKIINSINEVREFIKTDGFIEIILARNKNIKSEHFKEIALLDFQIKKIDKYLLKNKDFLNWCGHFKGVSRTVPTPMPARELNNPVISQTTNDNVDKFAQDFQNAKNVLSFKPALTELQRKKKLAQRTQYQKDKIKWIESKYGSNILEVKLLTQELRFLTDVGYQKSVQYFKELLEAENKFKIDKLKKKFDEYVKNGMQIIYMADEIGEMSRILAPLDTFKVNLAAQNAFPKQKIALMIIGDTGVGKTTLILRLLGYDLQETKINNMITLVTTKPLKPQHRNLVASSALSSVTQNLSAYSFSFKNTAISLIDSPGFSDTNGQEKDISNQISIEKAYQSCQSICYLYLVDLKSLKGMRGVMIIFLAKTIANRFAYDSLEDLEKMLLLVFNSKGSDGDHQILNLPKASKDLLMDCEYKLNKKQKIALQLVSERLNIKHSYFRPFQRIQQLKSDITGLNFKNKNKILRDLDHNFVRKINDFNQILEDNIQFYLSTGKIDVAKYHYDQLAILEKAISHESTITKKKIIDDKIKKQIEKIEEKLRSILNDKIACLAYKSQQFQQFIALLTNVKSFIAILNLTEVENRINAEIDKAFTKILASINSEATDEKFTIITELCSQFFTQQIFKNKIKASLKDIEKMVYEELKNLPKEIEHQYKGGNYQEFDKSLKSYVIFFKFYQSFQSKFAQQFNRIQSLKLPQDIKNTFVSKQEKKVALFLNSLQLIEEQFIKNNQMKLESIDQANKAHNSVLQFRQSVYISMAEQVDQILSKTKERLDEQCTNYSQQFENSLEFNDSQSQSSHDNRLQYQILVQNMHIIIQNISIVPIKDTISNLNNLIKSKLIKFAASFESKLTSATENINKLQLRQDYRMLSNIKEKIAFIQIFEDGRRLDLKTKWKLLRNELNKFSSKLDEALQQQLNKCNSEKIKFIYNGMKHLKMYEGIDDKRNELIKKYEDLLQQREKSYMDYLKARITIKQIKSKSEYLVFNGEYINIMRSYIDGILTQGFNENDSKSHELHEEIFQINANTLQRIFEVIKLCLKIASGYPDHQNKLGEEENQFELTLQTNYYYITVLGEIYTNLKKINDDKFKLYIKNELYHFNSKGRIDPEEQMLPMIRQFPEKKYNEINLFVTTSNKLMTSTSSSSTHAFKKIKIDKCMHYLNQTEHLKLFLSRIRHTVNEDLQLDEKFTIIQSELNILINNYNQKQLSRIEKAIILEPILSIPYMQECESIYREIKQRLSQNGTENLINYIQRLQTYIHRKIEIYQRTFDSCEDYLGYDNILNLNESIFYRLEFSKFILVEDVKLYKIAFFKKLDDVIEHISEQVENGIQSKLNTLEQKIQQRNFDQIDQDLSRLQKISNKLFSYFKENMNVNTEGQSLHQQLHNHFNKIKKNIDKIAIIKKQRENQTSMDQQIAARPFEGKNKQKIIEVFIHSKKPHFQQMMKKNIEQKFAELLDKYDKCDYSVSNNYARQINDFLPYIPLEIAKDYEFKQQFRTIKNKKLQKQRNYLDKLKNHENKANSSSNLNKILNKYNQFSYNQNLEMKQQAFELIKSELNSILSQVITQTDIMSKIQLGRQKFWSLSYKSMINDAQTWTMDAEAYFKSIEDDIFQSMAKLVNRALNELDKYVNDEISTINKQQLQGYCKIYQVFILIFKEQKQKVHFADKYQQLIQQIQNDTNQWMKNFDIVCPLSKFQSFFEGKQINPKNAKNYLKNCLLKTTIYSIIFKDSTNNMDKKLNDEQIHQKMEIQFDASPESIPQKINNFRMKIDTNIKKLKGQLSEIQFEQYLKLNSDQLAQKLILANDQATILQVYEQSLNANDYGYGFESTHFAIIINTIRNKLSNFVNKFLNSLAEALNDLQKQVPSELYFLEMLFQKISTNCCRKIFDNLTSDQPKQNETMSDHSYSKYALNPTKQFNSFIEQHLSNLKSILRNVRFEYFATKDKAEQMRKRKETMQQNMNIAINELYKQYQNNINSIMEQNQGKSPQEIDKKKQEANRLFELNRENQEEVWNKKLEALSRTNDEQVGRIKKQYSYMLLNLKKLEFNFHSSNSAKVKIAQMIKIELDQIKKAKMLRTISRDLEEYNCQNYAYLLKSNSPHFKFEQYLEFNKKTEAQDISYVMNELKTMYEVLQTKYYNKKDKQFLQKIKFELQVQYNDFKKYYFQLLKENSNLSFENRIQIIISKYKQAGRVQKLACILSVWSLSEKSKNVDDDITINNEEGESLDINPHPVQVAALILLTKPNEKEEFKSQLIQILTGEGKSIVLATLAIFIAKTQVSVTVSCYSSYLCIRDFKNFQPLFTLFKVKHLISYNTFNQICEKVLNNREQSTQQRILQILMNKTSRGGSLSIGATINKKSILLIDEVDVFFEKEYFGNTYRPALKLNDQISKDFIKYVYGQLQKNNKITTSDLAASKEFKKLVANYPKIEQILRNQLYRMKTEYLKPENKYVVDQKLIKYKDKDKMSEKLHFGYETIFAYCRQFNNGKISPENYEKALFIPLIYGEFSYSELPKCYSAIIGLSGTIQHLPQQKITYLEKDYKIEKKSMLILPSIYGDQHSKKQMFNIINQKKYYPYLVEKIREELGKGRPVLVCLKTYFELQKLIEHEEFVKSKLKFASLHEHLDNDLRDKCIMTVGTPNRLTLMTAEFSRGTDFIISDKKIQKIGGLHLILTYVPQLRSEFIQFKGRTGRQGQDGSIHAIITEREAHEKNIKEDYEDDIICNFDKYMEKISSDEDIQNKKKLEQSFKNHQQTQKYLENIYKSVDQYIDFLFNLNKVYVGRQTPTKIIVGIDGTNSMQRTFDELIRQLKIIMTRIKELQKEELNGSFQVQIVVYRNYNSGEKILLISEFQENLQKLQPFLSQIKVEGGMGNEAVELLYRHINMIGDIDMLILIGDAPPNTNQDVSRNRKDNEWIRFMKSKAGMNALYDTTTCTEEEKKFNKNIIINGLYINGNKYVEGKSAEKYFKEIASRHKGEAKELNFNKSDYSENLVEFFTTKILIAVNGNENVEKINKLYRDKFRSYTS